MGFWAAVFLVAGCFIRSIDAKRTQEDIVLGRLGSEIRQALDSSRELTLYSLQPGDMELDSQDLKTKPTFHGYLILGKTSVTDAKAKSDLLAAFYKGISDSNGDMAKCFEPRHGIHVLGNNKSIDLVICFHCEQIEVYEDQKMRFVPITDSPKAVFNRILSQAGIHLAQDRKKRR
jgi:hypothetical protein